MENKLRNIILVLSVSLNLGFIAAWALRTIPDRIQPPETAVTATDAFDVSSSFHRELGVTPEQWTQIEPLLTTFRDVATRQRLEIMQLRGQLFALLASPSVDKVALGEKQQEILDAQHRMQNLVMTHLLQEKEILTTSQSEKLLQALLAQSRKKGVIQKSFGLEQLWKDSSVSKETIHEKNTEQQ
jgi:Spy/CpxP family protein refolding chaperone